FRNGENRFQKEKIQDIQKRTADQINFLDKTIKRFINPHRYPVGIEEALYNRRLQLIFKYRKETRDTDS
ncbi:MAG: nicotinate phosphoribosyltransferase, partial [Bacteroidota bacterium]